MMCLKLKNQSRRASRPQPPTRGDTSAPLFRGRFLGEGFMKKITIEMTDADIEETLVRIEDLVLRLESLSEQINIITDHIQQEDKSD